MAAVTSNTSFLNNAGKIAVQYIRLGHEDDPVQRIGPDGKAVTPKPGQVFAKAKEFITFVFYEKSGNLKQIEYGNGNDGSHLNITFGDGAGSTLAFGPEKELKHGAISSYLFETADKLPQGLKPFISRAEFKNGHITSYEVTQKNGTPVLDSVFNIGTSEAEFTLKAPGLAKPLTFSGKGGIDALRLLDPADLLAAGTRLITNDGGSFKLIGNDGASLIANDGGSLKILDAKLFAKGAALETTRLDKLISEDAGSFQYTSKGTPFAVSGGKIVATGGGNVIGNDGHSRAVPGAAASEAAAAAASGSAALSPSALLAAAAVHFLDTGPNGFFKDLRIGDAGASRSPVFGLVGLSDSRDAEDLRAAAAKAPADLRPLSVAVNKLALHAGETIKVDWKISNTGSVALDPSTSFAWLSRDAKLGGKDDILIGKAVDPLLLSKQVSADDAALKLPAGLAPGKYYVIVNANGDGQAKENGTNNQSKPIAISVEPKGKVPDLEITSTSLSTSKGVAGDTVKVEYTLKETNGLAVGASTTKLYISEDAKFDSSDVLLDTNFDPKLLPGGSLNTDFTFKVPGDLDAGTYHIFARANADGKAAAADGKLNEDQSNNLSGPLKFTVASTAKAPDLKITQAGVSVFSGSVGDTITVKYTLKEAAGLEAAPSRTGVFLSTDRTITADDQFLGVHADPRVSASGAIKGAVSFELPAGLKAGEYFIGVIADFAHRLPEANEGNNVSQPLPFTVKDAAPSTGGDLTIHDLALDTTSATAGDFITLQYVVENAGAQTSLGTTTKIYLSKDMTFDASDKELLSAIELVPGEGQSSHNGSFVELPSGIAPGTYFVAAVADALKTQAEPNEANNLSNILQLTVMGNGAKHLVTVDSFDFDGGAQTVRLAAPGFFEGNGTDDAAGWQDDAPVPDAGVYHILPAEVPGAGAGDLFLL